MHSYPMNIDLEFLSSTLDLVEYESNFFYPGLDIKVLAGKTDYVIHYRWITFLETRKGHYTGRYSTVNLREGETVTPLMKCMDRYYIAAHETLHFLADEYLYDETEDPHQVEYYFTSWALDNNLPSDYSVEGRLYSLIKRKCEFK